MTDHFGSEHRDAATRQQRMRDTSSTQLSVGDSTSISIVPPGSPYGPFPYPVGCEHYASGQLDHSASSGLFYIQGQWAAARRHTRSVSVACTNCREVKRKCDNGAPCDRCFRAGMADTCVRPSKKVRARRTHLPRATQDAFPPGHWVPPHVATQRGAGTVLTSPDHTANYLTHPSHLFASGDGTSSSTSHYSMNLNLNVEARRPEYQPAVQDAVPGVAGEQGSAMNIKLESLSAYMDRLDTQAIGNNAQPGECLLTSTGGVATAETYGAPYGETYGAPYSKTYVAPYGALSTAMSCFHPH